MKHNSVFESRREDLTINDDEIISRQPFSFTGLNDVCAIDGNLSRESSYFDTEKCKTSVHGILYKKKGPKPISFRFGKAWSRYFFSIMINNNLSYYRGSFTNLTQIHRVNPVQSISLKYDDIVIVVGEEIKSAPTKFIFRLSSKKGKYDWLLAAKSKFEVQFWLDGLGTYCKEIVFAYGFSGFANQCRLEKYNYTMHQRETNLNRDTNNTNMNSNTNTNTKSSHIENNPIVSRDNTSTDRVVAMLSLCCEEVEETPDMSLTKVVVGSPTKAQGRVDQFMEISDAKEVIYQPNIHVLWEGWTQKFEVGSNMLKSRYVVVYRNFLEWWKSPVVTNNSRRISLRLTPKESDLQEELQQMISKGIPKQPVHSCNLAETGFSLTGRMKLTPTTIVQTAKDGSTTFLLSNETRVDIDHYSVIVVIHVANSSEGNKLYAALTHHLAASRLRSTSAVTRARSLGHTIGDKPSPPSLSNTSREVLEKTVVATSDDDASPPPTIHHNDPFRTPMVACCYYIVTSVKGVIVTKRKDWNSKKVTHVPMGTILPILRRVDFHGFIRMKTHGGWLFEKNVSKLSSTSYKSTANVRPILPIQFHKTLEVSVLQYDIKESPFAPMLSYLCCYVNSKTLHISLVLQISSSLFGQSWTIQRSYDDCYELYCQLQFLTENGFSDALLLDISALFPLDLFDKLSMVTDEIERLRLFLDAVLREVDFMRWGLLYQFLVPSMSDISAFFGQWPDTSLSLGAWNGKKTSFSSSNQIEDFYPPDDPIKEMVYGMRTYMGKTISRQTTIESEAAFLNSPIMRFDTVDVDKLIEEDRVNEGTRYRFKSTRLSGAVLADMYLVNDSQKHCNASNLESEKSFRRMQSITESMHSDDDDEGTDVFNQRFTSDKVDNAIKPVNKLTSTASSMNLSDSKKTFAITSTRPSPARSQQNVERKNEPPNLSIEIPHASSENVLDDDPARRANQRRGSMFTEPADSPEISENISKNEPPNLTVEILHAPSTDTLDDGPVDLHNHGRGSMFMETAREGIPSLGSMYNQAPESSYNAVMPEPFFPDSPSKTTSDVCEWKAAFRRPSNTSEVPTDISSVANGDDVGYLDDIGLGSSVDLYSLEKRLWEVLHAEAEKYVHAGQDEFDSDALLNNFSGNSTAALSSARSDSSSLQSFASAVSEALSVVSDVVVRAFEEGNPLFDEDYIMYNPTVLRLPKLCRSSICPEQCSHGSSGENASQTGETARKSNKRDKKGKRTEVEIDKCNSSFVPMAPSDVSFAHALSKSSVALIWVKLKEVQEIFAHMSKPGRTRDLFVVLKANGQCYSSSIKMNSRNPSWESDQQEFLFYLTPGSSPCLIVELYDWDWFWKDSLIGSCAVALKPVLTKRGEWTALTAKTWHVDEACYKVVMSASVSSKASDKNRRSVSEVYEYEIWSMESSWTPPPVYSEHTTTLRTFRFVDLMHPGSIFGNSLEDISKKVVGGSQNMVERDWTLFQGSSLDPQGWCYSQTYDAEYYHSSNVRNSVFRRRLWRRFYVSI